jgi:hypothetical protein
MSKKAGATADKPTVMVNGQPKTLPEEDFWQRYSPHYEFPLSSVTSAAIHIIAIALVIVGLVALLNGWWKGKEPPNVEPIELVGGGGGSPSGVGSGPGDGAPPQPPKEAVNEKPDPKKPVPVASLPDLPSGAVDPVTLPNYKTDDGPAVDIGNQAVQAMAALNESARKTVFNNLAQGQGQGGSGSGGGMGSGTGTGTGDQTGPGSGKGKLSERQKRLLRWTMVFNTRSGADYLRQLALLQAIIAIPEPDGQYRVYRVLQRGAMSKIEDLSDIKSIYWIDDRPESVRGLCDALGVPGQPQHFVAFFPQALEDRLAQLERDYRGLREDQIHSTRFEIINNEPRDTAQEPLRR